MSDFKDFQAKVDKISRSEHPFKFSCVQEDSSNIVPHVAEKQHMYARSNMCTLSFVCIRNIVQMSLGHPVTLVRMSFNHPVLLAWRQVSVGDSIECSDYTGTPMSNLAVAM